MNIQNVERVEVYYKNRYVGLISKKEDGSTSFIYSSAWLENGFSISPFLLPLQSKEFICDDYLIGFIFGVFQDCLPDSWGNYLTDKYLANKGINPNHISSLTRLTLLNDDSLGALTFKPCFLEKFSDQFKDFDNIKRFIDELFTEDKDFDEKMFDLYHKGSPTGGSRPKVNYCFDNDEYIVKFPSKWDEPECGYKEFQMNELARKCGLNVPDFKLVPSKECKGYFATKRFDRVNGEKVHVISLAGLFNLDPSLSQIHYKGFLQTVKALCPIDLEEAIRRMVFNYLIDNKDDHPRNFSFVYDESNDCYRLAPFFDITSTPTINEHMMQVNGKDNPSIEDFLADVTSIGFNKKRFLEIFEELKNIVKEVYPTRY